MLKAHHINAIAWGLLYISFFVATIIGGDLPQDKAGPEAANLDTADFPDSCNQELYPASDEFVPLDEQPQMIFQEPPVFPEMAKMSGNKSAEVWVRVLVDRCGHVRKAKIQIPSGNKSGFDEAALKAAWNCRFEPGILDGQPAAAWVTYKVVFRSDIKVSDLEK
jgi:TonB family protein